jgi:hypothetical protein
VPDRPARIRDEAAFVTIIGCRDGISAPKGVDHALQGDRTCPTAVSFLSKLSVPAVDRQPHRELDFGVTRWSCHASDVAVRRHSGRLNGRASRAGRWARERSRRNQSCGNRRVRQFHAAQALTRRLSRSRTRVCRNQHQTNRNETGLHESLRGRAHRTRYVIARLSSNRGRRSSHPPSPPTDQSESTMTPAGFRLRCRTPTPRSPFAGVHIIAIWSCGTLRPGVMECISVRLFRIVTG